MAERKKRIGSFPTPVLSGSGNEGPFAGHVAGKRLSMCSPSAYVM